MQAYLISSFILVFQERVSLHPRERDSTHPRRSQGGEGDFEEEENLISESSMTNPRGTNPSGTFQEPSPLLIMPR